MQYPTKYQMGQTVYTIQHGLAIKACPICNGRGYLRLRTRKRITCGDCFGNGTKEDYREPTWTIQQHTVHHIEIRVFSATEVRVQYELSGRNEDRAVPETNLYGSLLDAEVARALRAADEEQREERSRERSIDQRPPSGVVHGPEVEEQEEPADLSDKPVVYLKAHLWTQPNRWSSGARQYTDLKADVLRGFSDPASQSAFASVEILRIENLHPKPHE